MLLLYVFIEFIFFKRDSKEPLKFVKIQEDGLQTNFHEKISWNQIKVIEYSRLDKEFDTGPIIIHFDSANSKSKIQKLIIETNIFDCGLNEFESEIKKHFKNKVEIIVTD